MFYCQPQHPHHINEETQEVLTFKNEYHPKIIEITNLMNYLVKEIIMGSTTKNYEIIHHNNVQKNLKRKRSKSIISI